MNGKLVDSCALSLGNIHNAEERQLYVQGAINDLLDKWSDVIEEQGIQPDFYITNWNLFTGHDTPPQ